MRMKPSRIGWFMRRPGWGTVYLMAPESDPTLFKIGFTRRRTVDRRRELQRPEDGKLRIVCTITMPHAYLLEQRLLAKMRGGWRIFRRRANPRGTEWFHLRRGETLAQVEALMEFEARRLRLAAGLRFSWPWSGRIRHFRAIPGRALVRQA